MAWVTGDRLQGGKYTIERELGRGRFGITYLVKNRNSDRLVVKTLNDVLLNFDGDEARCKGAIAVDAGMARFSRVN